MPKPFRWEHHPEIADFVFSGFDQLGSPDLARLVAEKWQVNLSPSSVRAYCRFRRLQVSHSVSSSPPIPEIPAAADPPSPWSDRHPIPSVASSQELYHIARDLVEKREADSTAQTHLTCRRHAQSELPVAVAFWSDWQLGTHGVLMAQLEKDAQAIRDTEGLNVCVMGDLIQNLNRVKHPQSLHECVLPDPNEQEQLARYILDIAKPKIECLVDGNHEMNAKQASGLTLGPRWAKELEVPYLWHGGLVNYHVGAVEYKLGLRHRFRNESSLNTTNVQRNMSYLWPEADVLALGHKHFNDLQMSKRPLRTQVWMRCGTYQKRDDFGMEIGQYSGQWGVPLAICFPDSRCVLPVYGAHFYKGLRMLEFWRNEYRKGNPGPKPNRND